MVDVEKGLRRKKSPAVSVGDTIDQKVLGDGEGDRNEIRSLKGFPELIHG